MRAVRCLLLGALLVVAGATPPLDQSPPVASAQNPAAMKDVGLVVGNASFAPYFAVLRYDGRGRFVDLMVAGSVETFFVTCCITFGPDDNLYVSHPFGSSVLRYNGLTGAFIDEFVPAGSGGLAIPLILLFHDGHLYVGDTGMGAIRRYSAATGAYVDDFVPPGAAGASEFDLQAFVFGPDGNLYVAAEASLRILRFDGHTGAYLGDLVSPNEGFSPSGMTFGPDGYLYVSSPSSDEVRRYNVWTGTLVDVFIPPGYGGLDVPVGLAFAPDGDLYVTSVDNPGILRYDGRSGRFRGMFVTGGSGGLDAPRTLAFKSTVTICHGAPGSANRKTMTIGYMSGLDHMKHGDTIGPCQ
jgi:sugar lactone lactonase YvrE